MYDLVIKGGTVVDETGLFAADVAVIGGSIAVVGAIDGVARRVVDATGRYVLPGGLDAHCHLAQVSASGVRTADDFFTGTRSALHGGTTSLLAFTAQERGTTVRQAVENGLAAVRIAVGDAGLHLIVTDAAYDGFAADLQYAVESGITSLKIFTTYERLRLCGADLLTAVSVARRLGMTVMVHAEHHGMISWQTTRLLASGQTAPYGHAIAHSAEAEATSIAEIAAIARYVDLPIYLVHLSSAAGLEAVRAARTAGTELAVETCPHYLVLDEAAMREPVGTAVQFMSSPPVRTTDDRDALWEALSAREIQVVSSDHAPYLLTDGKLPKGDATAFHEAANGIAGVELRMPLLYSEGVRRGRLSLPDFVRVTAAQPAREFGLFPRKGTLQPGADADLAIWDDDATTTVTSAALHDAMDHTAYEGTVLTGWPTTVISAGEIVIADGATNYSQGRGSYLFRKP